MSYSKYILCLANSKKFSGHCIAGKVIQNGHAGAWIRPVSKRKTGEVMDAECLYNNGKKPEVMDIMLVSFEKPSPKYYQSENHILCSTEKWRFIKKAKWSDVLECLEPAPSRLWANGADSSHGKNDKVPESIAKTLGRSLYLIRPQELLLHVATEDGERKVRASFTLNTIQYKCAVTDSIIVRQFGKQKDGSYPIRDALLCISLGEIFYGYAYKLVAAVLTPDREA